MCCPVTNECAGMSNTRWSLSAAVTFEPLNLEPIHGCRSAMSQVYPILHHVHSHMTLLVRSTCVAKALSVQKGWALSDISSGCAAAFSRGQGLRSIIKLLAVCTSCKSLQSTNLQTLHAWICTLLLRKGCIHWRSTHGR